MAWNRASGEKKVENRGGQGNVHLRGLVAGLIVVIGAAVVWLCLPEGETRQEAASAKKARIKEVKPAAPKAEEKPVETNAPAASPYPYKDGRKVISSKTNKWQICDICIMPDGKRRKVLRRAKPPIWHNASDQVIAMAISGHPDEELPPLPISSDMEMDFVESLKTPIEIKPDDTEEIKALKQQVIEARAYIDEEMKKGRGYMEILNEHLAQRKQNAEAREAVMEAALQLRKEGDTELLNQYLEKANGYLRDIGAREVDPTPRRRRNREETEK